MKDINDDELQEMVEKNIVNATGSSSIDDKDVNAYSLIFEALSQQPEMPLAYNFPATVTAALLAKKNRVSDLKLFVLIAISFIILMIASYFYLNINSASTSQVVLNLLKYKWILLFGIAALSIIQFLDKKMAEPLMQE
ncbi:MAG: hypothetical protein ABIN89_08630 [Chitinophagaceae bacterium]